MFEQRLAQLRIGRQEQPILRRDQRGRAVLGAELQATLDEGGGEVGFAVRVVLLQMLPERVVLLASAEVRNVGDDQRVFPGQQFGCLGDATRGHGHFMDFRFQI